MLGTETFLFDFVLIMFVALLVLLVFYWFRQPSVVAYIAAGVVIGPHALGLIHESSLIETLGEFGVVLLLFFIGMEVSIESLIKNWRVVVLGTLAQITASVCLTGVLGLFLDWPFAQILLLGFVISLSSTAVILQFLETKNLIPTRLGKDVIGVLVAQDLLIIPMLIALSAMGGSFSVSTMLLQIVGAVVLIGLFMFLWVKQFRLPPAIERIATDNDYKLFFALVFCFGVALISEMFHLSLGMGAFIGGMMAAQIRNLDWLHDQLHGFKTLLIAVFFMSVGLLINVPFVWQNLLPILMIVALIFLANTFINALIFRLLRQSWRYSLYAGAILAQIGEFSFVLASVGLQIGAITTVGYQLAVAIIALSLVISPFWIRLFRRFEHVAVRH